MAARNWVAPAERHEARIALVHDVAEVAKAQAEILRGAGHHVDQIRLSQIGARWKWPWKLVCIPIRLVMFLPAILRLRSGAYDVIHIHWVNRGMLGVLASRRFLVQAHGSDVHLLNSVPILRALNRLVMDRADIIFYVTPNLAGHLREFDAKLRYLPNPVNVKALADAPRPADHVRRVVIFMRLDPVKGVDRVFPAVGRLADMVEVTAVAWGPLTPEYVRRYGRFVRFVDPVPHDQIGAFLDQFDLVIGQMEQGALGLSELEAMAAGKPLICGIDRLMYPGDKPPVVFAGDPDELVEQIERLKDDARRLANLSHEGREWVRRNHGYERQLQLLEDAYFGERALASTTPTAR